MKFKSGFISIFGQPNVGKSTLLNTLVGEKLAITGNKAQTTRHRLIGIRNQKDYQMVFLDTPGVMKPKYPLQERMMKSIKKTLTDADIILFLTDLGSKYQEMEVIKSILASNKSCIFLINKIDLAKGSQVYDKSLYWKEHYPKIEIIPISAKQNTHTSSLLQRILELLPEHPAYFDQDTITDQTERFICSEFLREKIFMYYEQEIPYCSEVVITDFKENNESIFIEAEIFIERESQKGIIIGKGGKSIKQVGTAARKEMELFFNKKIILKTFVKVEKDWRKSEKKLKNFGY